MALKLSPLALSLRQENSRRGHSLEFACSSSAYFELADLIPLLHCRVRETGKGELHSGLLFARVETSCVAEREIHPVGWSWGTLHKESMASQVKPSPSKHCLTWQSEVL